MNRLGMPGGGSPARPLICDGIESESRNNQPTLHAREITAEYPMFVVNRERRKVGTLSLKIGHEYHCLIIYGGWASGESHESEKTGNNIDNSICR